MIVQAAVRYFGGKKEAPHVLVRPLQNWVDTHEGRPARGAWAENLLAHSVWISPVTDRSLPFLRNHVASFSNFFLLLFVFCCCCYYYYRCHNRNTNLHLLLPPCRIKMLQMSLYTPEYFVFHFSSPLESGGLFKPCPLHKDSGCLHMEYLQHPAWSMQDTS